MTHYVALIRGVGPGDPQKTNTKLCEALAAMGFANPRSVISSGNVIFESDETDTDKLEATIEAGWPELLGFEATTIVKSQEQLQTLIDRDPFDGAPHEASSYLLITFFKRPITPDFDIPYHVPGKPYQVVGYTDKSLFTITDNTVMKTTDLMAWLEKQFGKDATSRTPLTIQRILKRMNTDL